MPDADENRPTAKPCLSREDRQWLDDRQRQSNAENRAAALKSIHLALLGGLCFIIGIVEGLLARSIYINRISTPSAAIRDADVDWTTYVVFWAFAIVAAVNVGIGLAPPQSSRLALWMWLRIGLLALSAAMLVFAAKWYLKK